MIKDYNILVYSSNIILLIIMGKINGIVNTRVLIGGIILAAILCCLLITLQIGLFPYLAIEPIQKVKLVLTPLASDTKVEGQESGSEQVIIDTPGVISTGVIVVIAGTGNEGLRMRAAPGTDQTVLFLAIEGEYFKVVDGPVITDALIWWEIQALNDVKKIGWSVQDYLIVSQP